MITTTDVANILVKDCQTFGLVVFQKRNMPEGEIRKERIVIIAKEQADGQYWKKGFVEVNFCVPNIRGEANLIRLQELERSAVSTLESVSVYDNSYYRYSVVSHGLEEDISMKCHYINVRLLFEVLNVK